MEKKLKFKPWVKDLLYGAYFGIMIYLIVMFSLGVFKI